MFKGLSGLGGLLKQATEIRGRMQGMNEELRAQRVSGSAGGGMVEIEANGMMEVLVCRIDPQLVTDGDAELIEELVKSAVNQAVRNGKELHANALQSMTGGMEMPGLDDAIGQFMGQIDTDETEDSGKTEDTDKTTSPPADS